MSEMEWLECFSEKLRTLIKEADHPQKYIADVAHMSEATLSRYLKGTQMPKGPAILNLAYALNCDVADLMDFGDDVEY